MLLALAPVFFVLLEAAHASRNVPYWDEYDTVLAFVLRLDDGMGPGRLLRELFAPDNEHRMLTSRIIVASYYALTGGVSFSILSMLGNASIVLLGGLLIVHAGSLARRLRLAVLLAFLLFHLQHYENFLWSGSSIDHFQVVLLAGAALIALARRTHASLGVGTVLGFLATFTLTHGFMVWPVGALMLALGRRWSHLAGWLAAGLVTTAAFLLGFKVNAAHEFAGFTLTGIADIAHYWLRLLGAPVALGVSWLAAWLGVVLLAALAWLASLGYWRREPVAFWLACFVIAALGAIAIGRTAQSGGIVHSRYIVQGALGWALVGFMALEQWTRPKRPFRALLRLLPALIAFNVAANHLFGARAAAWVEGRDRAAARYVQLGRDGHGPFFLHPIPERSTGLLHEAERRDLYRMPPLCEPRTFRNAKPSSRIVYYVDEMTVTPRAAYVAGWAGIRGVTSERHTLHVVLRSETAMHVFTTISASRPDVAKAEKSENWLWSGFRFTRLREGLPSGEFQLGFLITTDKGAEYIMTAHRLNLTGEGKALLATGN